MAAVDPPVSSRREALSQALVEHGDRLYSLALRITRDPDLASDAVQEAFATALQRAADFRGESRVGTWLHRIVYTKAIDLLRARGREAPLPDEEGGVRSAEDERLGGAPTWSRPPDEILFGSETREALEKALVELTELQSGVNREHDHLRAYIRSLVDLESPGAPRLLDRRTRFSVQARFDGSFLLVEHALQIMLEGARNVGVHARADSARINVGANAERVLITIDDDGVGFPAGATPPWSIASRAAELGGEVRVGGGDRPGGHLEIELPEA